MLRCSESCFLDDQILRRRSVTLPRKFGYSSQKRDTVLSIIGAFIAGDSRFCGVYALGQGGLS
jgi:hypothetical protein